MIGVSKRFSIEEGFRRLTEISEEGPRLPGRREFKDPLLVSLQACRLSSVIDEELERYHNPRSPVELITRVFRRFRTAKA